MKHFFERSAHTRGYIMFYKENGEKKEWNCTCYQKDVFEEGINLIKSAGLNEVAESVQRIKAEEIPLPPQYRGLISLNHFVEAAELALRLYMEDLVTMD